MTTATNSNAKKQLKARQQLNTRINKARARVRLNDVRIISTDAQNRIKNAFVSGSQAKTYDVIIRRNGYIETECRQVVLDGNLVNCKGGLNSVCYHAIATLIASANNRGLQSAICATEHDANQRANINGTVYKVQSRWADGNTLWFVIYGEQETEAVESRLEKNIRELGF